MSGGDWHEYLTTLLQLWPGRYSQCHFSEPTVLMKPYLVALSVSHL